VNIAQIIALHGRYRPDDPAIEAGERVIGYGELDLMVRRIVTRLKGTGVGQGDLVGLWLRDTPEYLAAMLAIARIGATVLPMDWRWTPAEAARIVARFPARVLVMEEDLQAPEGPMPLSLADLAAETPDQNPPASADRPFLYSLSSGTTGEPKAAVISHQAIVARSGYNIIGVGIRQRDRGMIPVPLYSGLGRAPTLAHLAKGATVVLFPSIFEPQELVEFVARRRIDTIHLVPSMARALLRLPSPATGPLLVGLRRIVSGAAGLHADERIEIRARLCPDLLDTYACQGIGYVSTADNDDQDAAPNSAGRPFMNVEVEIVGEDGRVLPAGETGWIRGRSPGQATAIVGAIGGSDERIEDGWCYPGDLGRFDRAGYLHLQGRSSEIIKRGGTTIHAAEVERVLASHPDVIEAAVVGAPDPELGETVVAFVVASKPVEPRALIVHCRRQLAPHKVPRRIVLIETLPRNPNGKVLKRELVQRLD